MSSPEYLEAIMGLIMYGGEAKGYATQAIRAAKQGDFEAAEQLLQEATASLNVAHKSQTNLLAKEASGESVELSLLMVHGQDHLMNALTFIDLAREFVEVYKKIS
ncbi:PTS lactose/cellobiose transporter subunit IIA [Streptococcus ruminantium]|uniref:PTS lactose/cellobiose transporter subunit IIA n=1 Tax=Streptococcus ruminantium TaxID=1917441 RepID=A0ABU1B6E0_9STRE|nr:PTS lactose/cellobiose transporter subunit IIA [Streptococcus ruminantium]MDQ8759978.1 PTS lactose/cellobiose transporter subunit IIA [Streptococcus ruminantium]MDQ8764129.1 PTS lactose/cellobiose transporter subunit IIA [Streptococcus ruminantium]MDQ8766970.1 PTS lactose/cellobiose transporter subunit IIA [Streptococcus ruminantium]MDQ8769032.1 PTS lactose/cellobiose transporter subunit IIA [Streptococcus ruminantium]MDQ8775573.1 PTS lactose/cellobiose transporter subunit IIA [Streptococcu